MSNITKISDHNGLSSSWSVKDMLERALTLIEDEPQYSKKAVLLCLDNDGTNDDGGENYRIRTLSAGFVKTSEIVVLLDVEKSEQKRDMGH